MSTTSTGSDNSSNDNNEGNGNNENDANEPAEKEQEAGGDGDSGVDSDTEELVPLNERCSKRLVQIVQVKSVQDHIIKLKSRNTSCNAFATTLSNP